MLHVFFHNDQLIAVLKEKKHFHRDRAEKITYKHKQLDYQLHQHKPLFVLYEWITFSKMHMDMI